MKPVLAARQQTESTSEVPSTKFLILGLFIVSVNLNCFISAFMSPSPSCSRICLFLEHLSCHFFLDTANIFWPSWEQHSGSSTFYSFLAATAKKSCFVAVPKFYNWLHTWFGFIKATFQGLLSASWDFFILQNHQFQKLLSHVWNSFCQIVKFMLPFFSFHNNVCRMSYFMQMLLFMRLLCHRRH